MILMTKEVKCDTFYCLKCRGIIYYQAVPNSRENHEDLGKSDKTFILVAWVHPTPLKIPKQT